MQHLSDKKLLSQSDDPDFRQKDKEESSQEDNLIISSKKVNLSTEKTLAEPTQQNTQQIQQKPDHLIAFPKESEITSILLKKTHRLRRLQANLACSIPERNLLVVVLADNTTINVFNTINFKLIIVKKSPSALVCMNYSEHLGMILLGGFDNYLQVLNAKTLDVVAETNKKGYRCFRGIAYLPQSDLIIARDTHEVCIFNTELKPLKQVMLADYNGIWSFKTAEFQEISKDLIFLAERSDKQKRIYTINLQTKTREEFTKVFIPSASCIELIEKEPINIFTCLAANKHQPSQTFNERHPFTLRQFTIGPESGEFALLKAPSLMHAFSKLSRLQNSPYLLAQKISLSSIQEVCVLSIKKDQVNVIRVLSKPLPMILDQLGTYIMMKGGPALVEINTKKMISIYRCKPISPKKKPN